MGKEVDQRKKWQHVTLNGRGKLLELCPKIDIETHVV